ncbi:hypothetical protein [Methylobacterium planeticum]|uniref:Head-tail adaptor protein n=1 Tax=Methylobacterium planeticum TaxID=2615211 RepID=A0A6N6MEP8_9HYPH|nr:hypothetical protein [Methylobacterium planeticum]KAB1069255.1 hypothetical protein F6X51_25615 [Methylobacterium planeticum]
MRGFDALWAEAVSDIEAVLGERIRILPQVVTGGWRGQAGADPSRAPVVIVGRYKTQSEITELEGNREGSKFQSMTRMSAATQIIRLSAAQIAILGYAPKAGDKAVLIDRPDQPTFTISSTGGQESGEMKLELVAGG